jgi:hypothetical protein
LDNPVFGPDHGGRFTGRNVLGGKVKTSPAGLEPATGGLENRCSIRLSYEDLKFFYGIAPEDDTSMQREDRAGE